ncbi:hypothetical protein LIER_31784 [Lithospermum erythrorhizon]|uniref:Integrase catalytic domain-containing protein n=1 Tax=Lithospermum erythrorhizon TaxID=34254 RepID=A0AAV3RXX4_LITER
MGACVEANSKALTQNILRSGIIWPSVAKDFQDHVRRCDVCRRHARSGRSIPVPEGDLHPIRGSAGTGHRQRDTIHCRDIEDLCWELGIEHRTASVSYPRANGQVEVMNQVIFKGVKKRLQEEGGNWDKELPTVLWSFRAMPNPITSKTTFSLVYGSDALLPVEILLEINED